MTREVRQTDDIATCQRLRHAVFVVEQGVPLPEEVDGRDPEARHLLAFADGVAVGTARLLTQGDIGKIGRVCVLRSHRGTGLGADLIHAALDLFRAQGDLRIARLGAQISALGFYEKLGFQAHGGDYMDAGIAHRDMDFRL